MRVTWHGPEPDIRCEWGSLSSGGGCFERATWSHRTGSFCDEHTAVASHAARLPLLRDPRVAACVVGAITGATPYRWPTDLLRAGVADQAMLAVALDHIEERGLYLPDAWPTEAGVDWPRIDKHGTGDNPHVWLPWRSGGSLRRDSAESIRDWSSLRRCPCGLFEHEARHCPECDGEGSTVEPADGYRTCPECRGTGLAETEAADVYEADITQRYLDGDPDVHL